MSKMATKAGKDTYAAMYAELPTGVVTSDILVDSALFFPGIAMAKLLGQDPQRGWLAVMLFRSLADASEATRALRINNDHGGGRFFVGSHSTGHVKESEIYLDKKVYTTAAEHFAEVFRCISDKSSGSSNSKNSSNNNNNKNRSNRSKNNSNNGDGDSNNDTKENKKSKEKKSKKSKNNAKNSAENNTKKGGILRRESMKDVSAFLKKDVFSGINVKEEIIWQAIIFIFIGADSLGCWRQERKRYIDWMRRREENSTHVDTGENDMTEDGSSEENEDSSGDMTVSDSRVGEWSQSDKGDIAFGKDGAGSDPGSGTDTETDDDVHARGDDCPTRRLILGSCAYKQRTADFEERMTSKCTLEKGSRVGLTLWGTVYGKTDTGASMVVVEGKANTAGVLVLPKDTQVVSTSKAEKTEEQWLKMAAIASRLEKMIDGAVEEESSNRARESDAMNASKKMRPTRNEEGATDS